MFSHSYIIPHPILLSPCLLGSYYEPVLKGHSALPIRKYNNVCIPLVKPIKHHELVTKSLIIPLLYIQNIYIYIIIIFFKVKLQMKIQCCKKNELMPEVFVKFLFILNMIFSPTYDGK